jgi:hypothetical protein
MKKNDSKGAGLKLLDVVALLNDIPAEKLTKGQVGTIVEELDGGAYEVEFADKKGKTITSLALKAQDMMLLYFEMETVA